MTLHVIQFSAGAGSAASAKRVAERYGTADMVLLFANTQIEDPDNYRFANDVATSLGVPLTTVADATGRDPMQVMRDKRWLGNSRLAHCSTYLKTIPCRNWLEANADPDDTVLYVGIDWSEMHRIPGNRKGWAPWTVEYPMTEPPYVDKHMMIAALREQGVEPPSMYADGYPHANCGGCCVKQGQAGWALTLRVHPDRYAAMEAFENEMRDELGDVSMMKTRIGDETHPFTLTQLRERVEAARLRDAPNALFDAYDPDDFGACGCMTDDISDPAALCETA